MTVLSNVGCLFSGLPSMAWSVFIYFSVYIFARFAFLLVVLESDLF